MSTTARRGCLSSSIVGLIVLLMASGAWAAPPKKGTGTTPPMKIYPCAGQLTRTPDLVITMEAGKAFYTATDNDAPVTTPPLVQGGAISVAESKAKSCNRRVIEVRVPSTTSSGCANCYAQAEINVCVGSFSGSKEFEEHCRVPVSSTSETDCKTFSHNVEVFWKPSGAANFTLTPLKTFVYKGFKDSTGCRVAAKYLGQIHDTAEVYPTVNPPASGMDVYRVLSLPRYKGNLLDTVIFVEYESMKR